MLLGWTLSRTHCLMSEAKRRGSDERSHFSFLVHLHNEREHEENVLRTHKVLIPVELPGKKIQSVLLYSTAQSIHTSDSMCR